MSPHLLPDANSINNFFTDATWNVPNPAQDLLNYLEVDSVLHFDSKTIGVDAVKHALISLNSSAIGTDKKSRKMLLLCIRKINFCMKTFVFLLFGKYHTEHLYQKSRSP